MDRIQSKFSKSIIERIENLKKENTLRPETMSAFDSFLMSVEDKRIDEIQDFKNRGGKVVGTLCSFVPEELIYASDAIPMSLSAGFEDTVSLAEKVFPRSFCPLIKSSFGLQLSKISPYYQLSDVAVVPATCDGMKKLSELLAECLETWIMSVPFTTYSTNSKKFFSGEIGLLKERLEKLTGHKITSDRLIAAMSLVNKKRQMIRRIVEFGKLDPPPISGRDILLVIQSSFFSDIHQWLEKAIELETELLRKSEQNTELSGSGNVRIMLAGCSNILPNFKIPDVVEETGNQSATIVFSESCFGARTQYHLVSPADADMNTLVESLAVRYMMNKCPCFIPNHHRLEQMLQWAREYNVSGVIYTNFPGCHLQKVEGVIIDKILRKNGIPVLTIESDYNLEDVEQLRTRVEAFIEMLQIEREVI